MENPNNNGEKPDGLEIISIGTLYKGPWDKKYWSSSRGKDRYPYPVGYHAIWTHGGSTYNMEIQEGPKGPLFVITSADGQSCSGQTPGIAWDHFQKQSGPRIKMWHAKRFSGKIDGVELFGFRNPFVQRLLRELVADVNGMAEPSLFSPNFCNGATALVCETRSPNSCTYPDLLPYFDEPQTTEERSRKQKVKAVDMIGEVSPKKLRPEDLSNNVDAALPRQDPGALPVPEDLETTVKVITPLEQSRLDSPDHCRFTHVVDEFSKEEKLLGRLPDADIQECGASAANDEEIFVEESEIIKDLDLCAPDTLDLQEMYEQSPCHSKDELIVAETVVSEGIVIESHPEEEMGISSTASSDKGDFDSVGQDVAKSMMTVLLPQALPLLKKTSRRERTTLCGMGSTETDLTANLIALKSHEENSGVYHLSNILPGKLEAEIPVESSNLDTEENVHISEPLCPDIKNSEDIKSIIQDSFEDDQCDFSVNENRSMCSDFVEADQAPLSKDKCDPHTLELFQSLDGKISLICHFGDCSNKETFCHDKVSMTHERLEKGEVLPFGPPLGYISPNKPIFVEESKVASMNLNSSLHTEIHCKMDGCIEDLEIASIRIEGPPVLKLAFSKYNDGQSPHAENTSKTDVANSNPTNEPSNVLSFRNNETALDPKLIALSSEATLLEQVFSSSGSTKNLETVNGQHSETKIIQYHRRHCSKASKFQNNNIHLDKAVYNAHENEYNPDSCELSNMTSIRNANLDGKLSSVHVFKREVDDIMGSTATSCASIQIPGVVPSIRGYNGPLSESIICRTVRDGLVPLTSPATMNLCATETGQVGAPEEGPNKKVSVVSEIILDRQDSQLHSKNAVGEPKSILFNVTPTVSQNQAVAAHAAKGDDTSSFLDPPVAHAEKCEIVNQMVGPCNLIECSNSVLRLQEEESSIGNIRCIFKDIPDPLTKPSNYQDCNNVLSNCELQQKYLFKDNCFELETEPDNESRGFVELVGRYVHPAPVLSVALSTKGYAIHICVLCGILLDEDRTLFIYKISTKEQGGGCPSLVAYSSIMFPVIKDRFGREISFERQGFQFTPDGDCLVCLNSIKAPSCRDQSIHCLCSACTSNSFEENAVKVVRVQIGYFSVVTKLKTIERVRSLLVCEPNHLVAVEESGRLDVWVMNSTWSAQVEEFVLQSFDCIFPCLMELKRIPNCSTLIIGHNGFGDFGLWDISKRIFLSRFSVPSNSIFGFLPVGLFSWQRKDTLSSSTNAEHIKKVTMGSKEMWFSGADENNIFHTLDAEDIAIWLLVTTAASDHLQNQPNDCKTSPIPLWRLALLVKNIAILGSVLDPRASTANVSVGHGIIGTHEGLVYMWELSTGTKLADLHHFKGGRVSCIAADSKSGVFAVAGDECQLVVYVHSPRVF
uniref:Uncharacterized protein n=1 Tax=Nelumbo nucifera TaxID=4432 RepID=A0A822YSL8_NELNU|nr:TPA_asm: hypothetical protein HUJ06_005733 [Nelumbo nucifera]